MKKILFFVLGIMLSGVAVASVVTISHKENGQSVSASEFNQVLNIVGNLYNSSGNVGIGAEPANGVKLDVNGILKLAPITLPACSVEGELVFDGSEKHLYGCTNGSWLQLDNPVCEPVCTCAADTCERSTCDNECQGLCNGTKTDGVCVTIGCGATTTVDDTEGNTYDIITIGEQCWMQENLNVGTMIVGSADTSDDGSFEKYCYADSEVNCTASGALYGWNEAMGYSDTEGMQGICPSGWHLPTDDEWKILENELGMTPAAQSSTGWRGTDQGDRLKIVGACADGENCNESEFTAFIDGYRNRNGAFNGTGTDTYFWSSSEATATTTWSRYLSSGYATVYRFNDNKDAGFAIRCIKGEGGGGCTQASDCDDTNPCTTDTCDSGNCSNSSVADGTSTGLCSQCDGSGNEEVKADDGNCGTIDCDGKDNYVQSGTESATTTETCTYNDYTDITTDRCEAIYDCKDENTDDCTSASESVSYTCGTCKYIAEGHCSGGTQGSCTNYASGEECGTDKECDGDGDCEDVCPPDDSCAATTCTGSTCTDDCGNVHTGTKSASNGEWGDWSESMCSGGMVELPQAMNQNYLTASLFAVTGIDPDTVIQTRVCENAFCGGTCVDDAEGGAIKTIDTCAMNEHCDNAVCVEDVGCTDDGDCAEGEICDDEICVTEEDMSCNETSECSSDYMCHNGTCVFGCEDTSNCSNPMNDICVYLYPTCEDGGCGVGSSNMSEGTSCTKNGQSGSCDGNGSCSTIQ
jgi:uncharacterized protein (TIGR02145 family)